MEVLAAKLAVEKLDDETKGKFEASIKKVEECIQDPNQADFSTLHGEMNYLLYSSAKSSNFMKC